MDGQGDAAAVLADLDAAVDAYAAIDVAALADPDVRASVLALLTVSKRLQGELSRTLAVFHERGLAVQDGFRTTQGWLHGFGRLSGRSAAAAVRATRITRLLPTLAESFRAGTVDAEHVDRIARLHERLGGDVAERAESILVPLAEAETPERLQQACDHITSVLDRDEITPDPLHERRGLTLSRLDGMWVLRGQLEPDAGAVLRSALDMFVKAPTAGETGTTAQRRADALTELSRWAMREGQTTPAGAVRQHVGILLPADLLPLLRPGSAEPSGSEPSWSEPSGSEPPEAELSEAGFSKAELAEAVQSGAGLSASAPPGAEDIGSGPDPAWLDAWGPVSRQIADRMLCDSEIFRLILDPASGLPLDLGRTYRLCPPWLRRALWARDRQCRWPGCSADRGWCDAHHVRGWAAQHGPTTADNMILLCRHHHVLAHEGRWRIAIDRDTGVLSVTRPDGRPYELGASAPWTTSHRLDMPQFGSPLEPAGDLGPSVFGFGIEPEADDGGDVPDQPDTS